MRLRIVACATAIIVGGSVVGFGALAGAQVHLGTSSDRFRPAAGHRLEGTTRLHAYQDTTSGNWSGYADVPPKGVAVTGVQGTWVVPTAGYLPPGFTASWIGIGGFSTGDLIQEGTASQTLPIAGGQYYAWYEELPAGETQLTGCKGDSSCTVNPGDKIASSIIETANNVFELTMVDAGHWSWTSPPIDYTSTGSSAEWILEAPSLVVETIPAQIGTANFGPVDTYEVNYGRARLPIANLYANPYQIQEDQYLITMAQPSSLAPGNESFNVCTYATSCATPS